MFKGHIVSKKEAGIGKWIALGVFSLAAGFFSEYSRIGGVYQGYEEGYNAGLGEGVAYGVKTTNEARDEQEEIKKELES